MAFGHADDARTAISPLIVATVGHRHNRLPAGRHRAAADDYCRTCMRDICAGIAIMPIKIERRVAAFIWALARAGR